MTQQEQKDWTKNVKWADDRQALLDDFAKAAMQQFLAYDISLQYGYDYNRVAENAYDMAEAMMQERERRIKG